MFPLHLLFLITLVLGSLVAINASSWLVAWVGLEVNLLSILPVMAVESTSGAAESCLKYFLVQSMASLIILISSVFVFTSVLFMSVSFIFIGLSIKLGVAPFHYWFPMVLEGLGWWSCLLLMTWQKLAPLFLLSFVKMLFVLVMLTSLVGALGGFGQTSIRKILAFSSVNHVGWMMAGLLCGVWVGMVYFGIYFFLSVLIVISLYSFKMFHLSHVGESSFFLKMVLLVNFLSLGGMPPLLGFFPKWFVMESLLWEFLMLSVVLIFSSLVSLYFYLRLMYPSLLLKYIGSEAETGVGWYMIGVVSLFFLSSGGFFCYPLLSNL
uniref:NADH-ubiquinone oxidoreductase chain 2 n=1 Tax=Heterometrus longimanus TaxID=1719223 RepID=A0A0U2IVA6_9SCOR|nr:NADH dehydrogenase subunit 3 [Heterometrus longimanus]